MSKKETLIQHINSILEQKIDKITNDIEDTKESMNSETKSSAGDKHETGRAMVQNEIESKMIQRANLQKLIDDVGQIVSNRNNDFVGFGSLVLTNKGKYFISVGLGKISHMEEDYYVISLDSPIGAILNGSKQNEVVRFRDQEILIEGIV